MIEIAPQRWIIELFHGPTLAFKDRALQVLAPMLGHFLTQRNRKAFMLCATSGDTGGAALSALSGLDRVKALVLYPRNGVSAFQERQMLGLASDRCQVVTVDGTFDDCQRIVKTLLADRPFSTRYALTAVNSVNWVRIIAQPADVPLSPSVITDSKHSTCGKPQQTSLDRRPQCQLPSVAS